jgi:hypothetical protein
MKRKSFRRLIGKRVKNVRLNPFQDARGTYHDPMIEFDGGIILRFLAQETECGEYGVELLVFEEE